MQKGCRRLMYRSGTLNQPEFKLITPFFVSRTGH